MITKLTLKLAQPVSLSRAKLLNSNVRVNLTLDRWTAGTLGEFSQKLQLKNAEFVVFQIISRIRITSYFDRPCPYFPQLVAYVCSI
ncbi:MAG: hypothetical protein MUE44_09410 [Oscillatoriaceae cyanobacterium Prado104]|jgi:hypothetical protein|nr:hypothetical protein [Oscillatoriaceae cyanobacterium Prado104]